MTGKADLTAVRELTAIMADLQQIHLRLADLCMALVTAETGRVMDREHGNDAGQG
jgi:hypothetical protein